MASEEKLVNVEQTMLKRIARMYETGLPIKEISEQLNMSVRTTKKALEIAWIRH